MKRYFAYTLLEMVAVIAIAAVLMSMAVPAFGHLLKGNAPGMAARELMGKIASARSYAAANRTYVAVVFPQAETNVSKNFKYTTYRLCEVTKSGTTYTFAKWLDGWSRFPQGTGVCVKVNTPADYSTSDAMAEASAPTSPQDKNKTVKNCVVSDMTGTAGSGTTADLANCIVFNQRGMPVDGAVRIPIQMGTVNDSGNWEHDAKYKHSSKYYCLPVVVRLTGKAKFFDTLVDP